MSEAEDVVTVLVPKPWHNGIKQVRPFLTHASALTIRTQGVEGGNQYR